VPDGPTRMTRRTEDGDDLQVEDAETDGQREKYSVINERQKKKN
jgi:hypothetical protein